MNRIKDFIKHLWKFLEINIFNSQVRNGGVATILATLIIPIAACIHLL